MRFERPQRVVYQRNPLAEVVCQIRFPKILRLESELPAAFQAKIKSKYPLTEITQNFMRFEARLTSATEIAGSPEISLPSRVFQFFDADKKWQLSLASDFVALTAIAYERWEIFRARLEEALLYVTEVYQPPLFTRLGLRYKDLIIRSAVNFTQDTPWSELVRPEILGPLAAPELTKAEVHAFESATILSLDPGSLALKINLVQHSETREKGIVIDSDFYLEANREPDVNSALKVLDEFNRQAGGLFRWSITERLHHALDPRAA